MSAQGLFVTGTDTEVGKTVASVQLIHWLVRRGLRVAAMKPVAAGATGDGAQRRNEDVMALGQASNVPAPLAMINPYCFAAPISPHLAAASEGVNIALAPICEAYQYLASQADVVVVEGAGGWLAPVSHSLRIADIALALRLPVVLVVGMRLGCLNHAQLSVAAIQASGAPLLGWIANTPGLPMAAYDENLASLRAMLAVPLLAEIHPHTDWATQSLVWQGPAWPPEKNAVIS
jgi:dethiobiotin synthetase